jgi:hypothetical protein
MEETANRAFEKFKSCRNQVSQSSMKKVKNLSIPVIILLFRYTTNSKTQKMMNKSNLSTKLKIIHPKNHF